jgi:hypothetical protein
MVKGKKVIKWNGELYENYEKVFTAMERNGMLPDGLVYDWENDDELYWMERYIIKEVLKQEVEEIPVK